MICVMCQNCSIIFCLLTILTYFCSDNDIINLGTQVSEELKKLKIWFAVNRLSLNIKKQTLCYLVNVNIIRI